MNIIELYSFSNIYDKIVNDPNLTYLLIHANIARGRDTQAINFMNNTSLFGYYAKIDYLNQKGGLVKLV